MRSLAALLGTSPAELEGVLANLGEAPQSLEDPVAPEVAELAALELGRVAVARAGLESGGCWVVYLLGLLWGQSASLYVI